MISKGIYFLRAPEDMKSPAEAAMFVVGSFIIYGFLASLPFFFFFTQMRSLAIGYFLTFLAMLAAEVFCARRRIYELKRFQVMGARLILIPFVAATAWQFWGVLRDINGELETLVLANMLSIISLSCLLHALRKQNIKRGEKSMLLHRNSTSGVHQIWRCAKWTGSFLVDGLKNDKGFLFSQIRWYCGLLAIIIMLGVAQLIWRFFLLGNGH